MRAIAPLLFPLLVSAQKASTTCKVTDVTVTEDSKGTATDGLDVSMIKTHIGEVSTIEWAYISSQYFSDVDGRHEGKILGTPGGDIAEFILAMSAYETLTKTTIDDATATGLLMEYLTTTSSRKFYMSTHEFAHANLTAASGCPNLDISDPPLVQQEKLLTAAVDPDNVGCKVLKNMLLSPTEAGVTLSTVQAGIKAFYSVMWNKTFAKHSSLTYMMLEGPSTEKAWVNVGTPPKCLDLELAPLVAPQTCYNSMYVNHPDAVMKLRTEFAYFIAGFYTPSTALLSMVDKEKEQSTKLAQDIAAKITDLGISLLATMVKKMTSYGIFTVDFAV